MSEEANTIAVSVSRLEGTRNNPTKKLKVDELAASVKDFVQKMSQVLNEVPQSVGQNFELSEFVVSAEISATGEIKILGSGVEASAGGGVSFTFTKKENPK